MRLWLREIRSKPMNLFLVVSLGISLAGGMTALSLYAAVRWRALPFAHSERLLSLEVETSAGHTRWWSGPELRALTEGLPGVDGVAGYTAADFNVVADRGQPPEALLATLVTADFFRVLAIDVRLGRAPAPDEFVDGGAPVVVLGHALWQRRYGGDPAIVGRTIRLSAPAYLGQADTDYRVIGVLPADAWLFWKRTDFVLPLRAGKGALADPDAHLIERVIARLERHSRISSATVAGLVERRLPPGRTRTDRVHVLPLARALFRDLTPQLRLVLVVASMVLGLAVLNMVIAVAADRLARRQTDTIRLALGATARRLAQDAALRMILTAAAAGLVGMVVATWLLNGVVGALPSAWLARVPGGGSAFRMTAPVLTGLAAALTLLVGSVGAWTYSTARRLSLNTGLAGSLPPDTPGRHRWRSWLVGSEVALGTATMIIAASLSSQLAGAQATDFGIDHDRTVAAWINPSTTAYADGHARARYFEDVIERVAAAPGIEAVGAVNFPFHFSWQAVPVRPSPDADVAPVQALDRSATPRYAAVAGLRVLDGRWFGRADTASSAPVAVVSAALARALWPTERAVGRTVAVGDQAPQSHATIIGVVSDTRATAHGDPSRTLFRPMAQSPPESMYLTLKAAPGTNVWRTVTSAVWAVNSDQPVDGPWSIDSWVADRKAGLSFLTTTAVALAALGAFIASVGLLGLAMHWVSASRREVSIRRALGANDPAIAWWLGRRWLGVLSPAMILGVALHWPLLTVTATAVEGLRGATSAEIACGVVVVMALSSVAVAWSAIVAQRIDPREITTR
jgi:putative ABC transport system permease protein